MLTRRAGRGLTIIARTVRMRRERKREEERGEDFGMSEMRPMV